MKRTEHIRADPIFKKELEEIALARVRLGRDKKLLRTARLTKAISNHTDWRTIKEDMLSADIQDDFK